MAANYDTAIRFSAKLDGSGLDQLKRGLQTLSQQSTVSKRTLDQLYTATKSLGAASGNTISSLKLQAQALGTLRDQAEFGSRKFRMLTKDIETVESRLKRFQTTAEKGTGLSRGGALLAGAAGGVAGALAVGAADSARQGLQGIASVGINAETAQVRLKALADQFGEYNEAQASAARIAATLRISQIEASDGFSKLYAALRPTGITLQELEDTFIGFTAAARASGATAEESSAALLQLKQALGSGILQGDELRSINEQAPAVGQAIAREMGVTIGELKKLGSEGKITTETVIRALAKLRGEKLGQLQSQFNTSAQAMKDLQVAAEDFGRTIAQVFGPKAVGLVKGFTEAVKRLNDITVGFRDPTAATAREVISSGRMPGGALPQAVLMQGAGELFKGTSGVGGVGLTGLRKEAEELAKVRRQPVNDVLFQLMRDRLGRVDSQRAAGSVEQQQNRDQSAKERNAATARAATGAASTTAKGAAATARESADTANRLAEETAKARIELDNRLHQNAIELVRKRYELERELQDRSADNWIKRYTGAARGAAGIISSALRGFDELAGRRRDADVGILNARQALSSAQRQGAADSALGVTSFTASQLQTATKEASRFTGVANMCSESVKAFYKSLGVTLPGVTAWADTVRKAGKTMTDWSQLRAGDIVATGRPGDTPHVGVYTGGDSVFHQSRGRGLKAGNYPDLNYFKQGGYFVRPSAMAGANAGSPGANGDAMQAGANLAQARALAALETGQIEKLKTSIGEGFVLDFTDQLRQQNAELINQNAITQLRNRLQMEGVRPEIIEAEAQKAQKFREVADEAGVASDAIRVLEAAGEGGSEQANRLREAITLQNENLLTFKTRTDEATAAQIAFNDALRFRQDNNIGAGLREGAQGYIESIGTMREATSQLARNGIGGIENALTTLATTGKANFREFAVDMLQQTSRMIIQQVVLRTVLQAVGAIGGGGAGASSLGSVASNLAQYAPLPSFAGGGFTGTGARSGGIDGQGGFMAMLHPRESVIDHARPVAMQGNGSSGTTTNVVINVDASGTKASGDPGAGNALARDLAAVVDARLLHHKRPGGILA